MRPQEKALQFLLRVIFFLAAEEQLLLRCTWSDLVFSSSLLLSILYLSLKLSICSSPILSLFLPALHSVIPTELFFCSSALSELPKSLCSFFLPHRNFFFLTYPIRYCFSSLVPLLGAQSYWFATQQSYLEHNHKEKTY